MHCVRRRFTSFFHRVASTEAAMLQSQTPLNICHCQALRMSSQAVQIAVESSEDLHGLDDKPRYLKTKKLTKTAAFIMQTLDKEAVAEAKTLRPVPDLRPGDVVQLKVEVPENKRRVSTFRGIVMAIRRSGLQSTFRIRRFLAGVGVELLFPMFSPNIKEMKVLEHRKVRRNKLYYLRDKMQDKRNKITWRLSLANSACGFKIT